MSCHGSEIPEGLLGDLACFWQSTGGFIWPCRSCLKTPQDTGPEDTLNTQYKDFRVRQKSPKRTANYFLEICIAKQIFQGISTPTLAFCSGCLFGSLMLTFPPFSPISLLPHSLLWFQSPSLYSRVPTSALSALNFYSLVFVASSNVSRAIHLEVLLPFQAQSFQKWSAAPSSSGTADALPSLKYI